MTIVYQVAPAEVDRAWAEAGPLVESAFRRDDGRFDMDEVLASLKEGRRQLWIAFEDGSRVSCALVTQIDVYPRRKVFRVFAIGGRLPAEWRRILGDLEHLAMEQGCTLSEIEGRKGWLRKLAGYRNPKVLLRKELVP